MSDPTIVSLTEERAKIARRIAEEAIEHWIDSESTETDVEAEIDQLDRMIRQLHCKIDRVETLLEELLRRVVTLEAR